MAMKDTTKTILKWLQNTSPEDNYTAQDIADALGMNVKSVNASITAGMINHGKGLAVREPAKMEIEDGKFKDVKIIHLTPKGYTYDPDSEGDKDKGE